MELSIPGNPFLSHRKLSLHSRESFFISQEIVISYETIHLRHIEGVLDAALARKKTCRGRGRARRERDAVLFSTLANINNINNAPLPLLSKISKPTSSSRRRI